MLQQQAVAALACLKCLLGLLLRRQRATYTCCSKRLAVDRGVSGALGKTQGVVTRLAFICSCTRCLSQSSEHAHAQHCGRSPQCTLHVVARNMRVQSSSSCLHTCQPHLPQQQQISWQQQQRRPESSCSRDCLCRGLEQGYQHVLARLCSCCKFNFAAQLREAEPCERERGKLGASHGRHTQGVDARLF
jgi:hypothetical protein